MMRSVLQDWVMKLPLREQGTLLTGIRGCDLAEKRLGVDTTERRLVAFLRYCVMHPMDPREVDIPGAFFQSKPPQKWKPSELGHFPQHWYSHLMHCFEVIGYRGPWPIADEAYEIYVELVHNLHLQPESFEDMILRFSEDR